MLADFERFENLTANDKPTLRASEHLREITRQVNLSTVLTGSGSPEGAIEAEPTQMYMDTAGSAGSILYIKQTGISDTGWILV